MPIDQAMWKFIQEHLGYDDEQMALFKSRSKNAEIVEAAPALMSKTIVAEVVDAHGCASQHKVGDKFYFDGAGNLLTQHAPKRVCVHALAALSGSMYVVNELFYAGADPNDMRLNRVGCFDVGVQCGGWGHVAMEVTMHDTAELDLK